MKFWCNNCDNLVDALTFEENDEGEASTHNGVGEHSHCDVCSNNLTLADCRDLDYVETRLRLNKEQLDEHGAQPVIPGQPLKITSFELLKQAQDDEKMLLFAHDATLTLKQEGKL